MQNLKSIVVLSVLLLSAGCIRSLHPIYTEQDIVFEPSLIGQWSEDDSEETWTFSKQGTNSYKFVYTDKKGRQGTFKAHLVKIKGHLFLDFFPRKPDLKENDFYRFHLLPVHTFVHVKQINPTLQMSFPEPDWLKKVVADNPEAIRHERLEKEIVLTAETKELQTFWLKHLEHKGCFRRGNELEA